MLESIRNSRNSILILFVFAAIIIVFIFWGVGPTGNNSPDRTAVATVNGTSIAVKDYLNYYKSEVEYYKNTLKGEFTDEVAQRMNLKQKVIDILVNRALVIDAARSEGIEVKPEEVQARIMGMEVFQKNGVFDKDLYFKVLGANRLKPAEFEESMVNDLLASKMSEKIAGGVDVTDDEIRQAYMEANRQINLNYVYYDAKDFTDDAVTDEEAKVYLEGHSREFMVPSRTNAFYAYVDYNDISKKIKVQDDEIRDYYEKNQQEFQARPEVKARHILIRLDDSAPDVSWQQAKDAARKKAEELLDRLGKGEKFAELAKKYSNDPGSAEKGGDLGWFPRGVMIKPFEEVAFNLGKGDTSEVVETEFGFHIINVQDKKEGGVSPLSEVSSRIRKVLTRQKTQKKAEDLLAPLARLLKEAGDEEALKKAADVDGVKSVATGLFADKDRKVELVRQDKLMDSVVMLNPGDVSRVIESGDRMYIIKLLDRQPSHLPAYDDIAGEVKKRVAAEKAAETADKLAAEFLAKVKEGAEFESLAKDEKLKVKSTGFFTRADGYIRVIGALAADKPELYKLTEEDPYYPEVFTHRTRHYVLKLREAKEADVEGLEKVRDDLYANLLARKRERALTDWLTERRAKADIVINQELL